MMDYAAFEIITTPSKPPTHCSGKNGTPPIVSGAHYQQCNREEGCITRDSSHHYCAQKTDALYCECDKNNDRDEGSARKIKHYFSRSEGNMNEYSTLCIYCSEHCDQ